MSRTKYVDMEIGDETMALLREHGWVVRRGNQHGSAWYLTKEGGEHVLAYIRTSVRALEYRKKALAKLVGRVES